MGIIECEKLKEKYDELLKRHKLLERKYMELVEECSKKD